MAETPGETPLQVASLREEVMEIDSRALEWLLDGLDFTHIHGHEKLAYNTVV